MHWIPGQARNDVGLGAGGGGLWAIPPVWIPGQARNDVGWRLGLRLFLDVGLGVSALRRAPLPAVCV